MKDTGDIAKELLERLPKPNIYILQLLKKTEENEQLKAENEELKTIILKIISSKEIGYTVKDKMNDITMICRFGIDDSFRKIREFLFEK